MPSPPASRTRPLRARKLPLVTPTAEAEIEEGIAASIGLVDLREQEGKGEEKLAAVVILCPRLPVPDHRHSSSRIGGQGHS